MTVKLMQQIDYWIKGSKKALDVAQSLFEKKHYPESLFFCHLAVEKLLKAAVVKSTRNSILPHGIRMNNNNSQSATATKEQRTLI